MKRPSHKTKDREKYATYLDRNDLDFLRKYQERIGVPVSEEYLEKYRHNRRPSFRIKVWEYPQLSHVIGGRRSLLHRFDLVKEKDKIRSLQQIQNAEQGYESKIWYGRSGLSD
jgi:hypothetical protein